MNIEVLAVVSDIIRNAIQMKCNKERVNKAILNILNVTLSWHHSCITLKGAISISCTISVLNSRTSIVSAFVVLIHHILKIVINLIVHLSNTTFEVITI